MKTPSLSALLSLFLVSVSPAAELIVPNDTIIPSTTLELRFDESMIPKERVGEVDPASPLVGKPEITGEFKWTSTRSGQFRFTKPPQLGTKYTFSLKEGLADASGKTLPKEILGEFATANFSLSDQWRDYPYGYGDSAKRIARYLLQFNDEVKPEDAADTFYFTSSDNNVQIPAKVTAATYEDFKRGYGQTPQATWAELATGTTNPTLKKESPRTNALLVESAEPLPVGRNWQLNIAPRFKNASNTAAFVASQKLVWGNVLPLSVKTIRAETHFDSPHEIIVSFNKAMGSSELKPEELNERAKGFVSVEPAVPGMEINVGYNAIAIKGDFALDTEYTVRVRDGVPGGDGLPLEIPFQNLAIFRASDPYVSTSVEINNQLALGNGIFDIYAANFKELHIRVKQLESGELLRARQLYADSYQSWDDIRKESKVRSVPYENFPGVEIYNKVITNQKPLEKSSVINLNWKEILGGTAAAPLFVEIIGSAQDGAPAKTVYNRAIVEFTDIGLLLKNSGKDALVYAFSLKTGAPLADVDLTFADADRGYLRQGKTDAQGLAKIASRDAGWMLAQKGADCTAMNFKSGDSRIGLWNQGINLTWRSPWQDRLQTTIFSDRPVYKPGETAHVKAIARYRNGDDYTLGTLPIAAKLTLSDPNDREILTKDITFTPNGSWADDIKLPDGATGWYGLKLVFKKPVAPGAKANSDDEDEEDDTTSYFSLRVDEYKPNTFEVKLEGSKHTLEPGHVKVPLSANYYMGKALSKAKVSWSASLADDYTPPAAYSEYHFGDAPTWWNYGKDRDDETATDDEETESSWSAHGEELALDEHGKAIIDLPEPPLHKAALPQTINIYADVTDINQQTISASTEFKLPGAEFIVGARKHSWYANTGKEFSLEFVAITPEGKPFTAAVPVEVRIERQEWSTVRVEGTGGAAVTKNQSTLVEVYKNTVNLASQNQQASTGTATFTPNKSGTYFMTATAIDASGKNILSRVPFYVIGNGGFPWSWEDGAQMTLQPDKTSVKPGEEVSIVVKTPFAGKALVTVERNHIHRAFFADISPENPVVKVTLDDADAPNAYISVIVMRGMDASPQPDPMPEYKIGYCEIKVKSDQQRLFVEAKPSLDPILPGAELTIVTTVKDAAQQPVADAEVTLYAVDEGVLSLMSYETPQPYDYFHRDQPLAVASYTTLDSLVEEALDKRYRGNKGVVVGGGGDEASADDALRKNFVATALWQASVTTDAEGKITTTFKVPDSMTRYRIMAIATKNANLFGTGQSAFVINKPLMVEPVVPRFAHTGDEILLKAVVHNTTTESGTVEVELKLDDTAQLIKEARPYALVGLNDRKIADDARSERRSITLKAGETAALAFPVHFTKQGSASWEWHAKTTEWSGKALTDAMETKFEVTHPSPALREVHYLQIDQAKADTNLLLQVNPQLLESEGTARLDVNQSRLSEARGALEYLLHYPYGCVEQTTSSTLPWLALSKYEPLFPDLLAKDKVRTAIQQGADRILAMQTESGGLGYWPGSDKPLLWASAYGGFCLLKSKEWGIDIPQAPIDKLTTWMSAQLRGRNLAATTDTTELNDAALALYTLAKAGKAEPAYQNTLYTRRERLPEAARLYLALAMCLTKSPDKQIADLIKPVVKPKNKWEGFWLGGNTLNGLRLIICAHIGLTNESNALADELFKARQLSSGHWGTTFSNSWVLLGLTAMENSTVSKGDPVPLQLTWGDRKNDALLQTPLSNTTAFFDFDQAKGAKPLKVAVPEGKTVRGRLEVKSWPDLKTFQPVQKGFGLKRQYERLTNAGVLEPAENLRVGDLIVVTLEIDVQRGNRYLAVEDRLPSVFEPVNPEFTTQNARPDAAVHNPWSVDHTELRHDRALFFTDDVSAKGKFQLQYLARVIAEGDVIAPPARIEAMYDPEHYGLSEIHQVQTLPAPVGDDVAQR